jgi:hypothetical protein
VTAVAIREVWRGRIWLARAWRLVDETPDVVVLANRPGSETRVPVGDDGARLRVPQDGWRLRRSRWENWTLRVARRGDPFSTLLFFDDCGTFLSWYVNFERPLVRTHIGWDTLDWKLDLVALPNGTARLKDEDELEEAIALELFSSDDAAGFRAEGEHAARSIIERRPPFDEPWEEWRPDPAWQLPELPDGWDRI